MSARVHWGPKMKHELKGLRLRDPDSNETGIDIPSGCVLLAYRGSAAHGMYVPPDDPTAIDDVDLIGIVAAPENCYLGLQKWGSDGTIEIKSGRYDAVFYEIRKAFRLFLQGNPNILSLLWTPLEHILFCDNLGKMILDNRQLFVGKHVYSPFAGYASGQLKKMETRDPAELREYLGVTAELKRRGKHPNQTPTEAIRARELWMEAQIGKHYDAQYEQWGEEKLIQRLRSYQKKGENIGYMGEKRKGLVLEHGYDSKNAAHLIRLLRMAKEFFLSGHLHVDRSRPCVCVEDSDSHTRGMICFEPDANELLAIKRGEWELERIKEHADKLFDEVRQARDESALPETGNHDRAEELLVTILRQCLRVDMLPQQR